MSADIANNGGPTTATKPTKLKASCDFCALSKIKCDRGQPQCLRCIKAGIGCHYSETRRIGKARQVYAASHTRPGSLGLQGTSRPQQSSTPQAQQKPTNHGTRRTPNNLNQVHPRDGCGSSDYAMSLNLFDFLSQNPESLVSSLGHMRQERAHSDVNELENMVGLSPSPESSGDFLPHLREPAELEGGGMKNIHSLDLEADCIWDVTVSGPPSTGGHTANCVHRASTMLQTMHVTSTCARSESPPMKPMLTLDVALQNNRLATDTVREIMDCPCSHSLCVALLLVLITHQAMESYRSLLAQQQSSPPVSRDQSAPATDPFFPVHDTPLAIGGYLLDDNMRTKVVVNIIQSELEKMGSFLDMFAGFAEIMRNQLEKAVLGTYIGLLQAGLNDLLHSVDNQGVEV